MESRLAAVEAALGLPSDAGAAGAAAAPAEVAEVSG